MPDDNALPRGLSIRSNPNGGRSFRLTCRHQGRRLRTTLDLDPDCPKQHARAVQIARALNTARTLANFDPAQFFPTDAPRRPTIAARTPVREAVQAWIDETRGILAHSTLRAAESALRSYCRQPAGFGDVALADLAPAHIRAWIAARGYTRNTYDTQTHALRSVIAQAIDDEVIAKNPLRADTVQTKIRQLQPHGPRKENIDPYAEEEITPLLAAAAAAFGGGFRNLLQLGFYSGLRICELISLDWKDVQLSEGTLKVTASMVNRRLGPPKNRYSRRTVYLTHAARKALEAQQRITGKDGAGRVFLHPRTGEPFAYAESLKRLWNEVHASAGIRRRFPYSMRHTFISHMLEAGEPPDFVREQVGHRDLTQIMQTYWRLINRGRAGGYRWRAPYGSGTTTPAEPARARSGRRHGTATATADVVRLGPFGPRGRRPFRKQLINNE